MCGLIETTVGIEVFCGCLTCEGIGWVLDPDAEPDLWAEAAFVPCICNPNGLDV